jgi:putative tricarboxylic transport membrane protein
MQPLWFKPLHAVAFLAGALIPATAAQAQSAWRPEKAVEIVLPTAPGGTNDLLTRLIQKVLQDGKLVSAPIVVMNKAGGNQSLALLYVTQRAPDPHYLMFATATVFTNQLAGLTPLGYADLTPIAVLVVDHTVITVRADSPIRSMHDMVERLKADPEALAFGMVARGGPNHLALSQAMRSAGVDPKKLKTVVFKTNGESMSAVVGGHIHAVVSSVSAALPQSRAGNTRLLAVAAAKRLTGEQSSIPTMREQGIDATGISNWRAIFATKGVTPAQAAFWEEAMARMAASEEWHRRIAATTFAHNFLRGREFAKYLDEEFAATKAVMTDLGLVKQ